MPNWCSNTVVLGNSDASKISDLLAFLEKNQNNNMFQYLRPNPSGEWDYDWSVQHWGTKWDTEVSYVVPFDENHVSLDFDTPWGPPITLYQYLVEHGWTVEAMYSEPGCQFCGAYVNGNEEYYEYDLEDPETYECIPDELYNYVGIDIMLEEFKQESEENAE